MSVRRLPDPRRCCPLVAVALAAACLPMTASATLESGSNDPEMYLFIWDEAREASYTLDLGLHVSTLRGDGQSDNGYQRFWTLDPASDPNLALLLTGGSAVSALQWGVTAADQDGFIFLPGDLWVYTTLQHTTPTGTVNPVYSAMLDRTNNQLEQAINIVAQYANWVASNPATNNQIYNVDVTNYALNGSAFALKGEVAYSDDALNGGIQNLTGVIDGPLVLNTIGRSSWAYMLTTSGFGEFDGLVTADEFDNLEHDAFWGLAQDPATGILYLSYTLDAVGPTAAQREFALGIGRTEFGSGFSVRRLDGVAVAAGIESPAGFSRVLGAADFSAPMAPVPEPGSWALMALGLTGLAWLRSAARRPR